MTTFTVIERLCWIYAFFCMFFTPLTIRFLVGSIIDEKKAKESKIHK